MGAFARFLKNRIGSLVSKKVGAALLGEAAVTGTSLQGVPLCIYIVVQGAVDAWQYYVDRRWPAA